MRVLITRPKDKARSFADVLIAAGMEPVFFPTIEIIPPKDPAPLDEALHRLEEFSWLIFTSANTIEAVWERIEKLDIPIPSTLRIATVGPKTEASLKALGLHSHFTPDEYIADAILPGLGDVRGKHILLPLADIAHETLPKAIEGAGGFPHVVTAYHTIPAANQKAGLLELQKGMDAITFTSGSTVRNFITSVQGAGLDPFTLPGQPIIACIGPKTAEEARESGFRVDVVAESYTVEGLVEALIKLEGTDSQRTKKAPSIPSTAL